MSNDPKTAPEYHRGVQAAERIRTSPVMRLATKACTTAIAFFVLTGPPFAPFAAEAGWLTPRVSELVVPFLHRASGWLSFGFFVGALTVSTWMHVQALMPLLKGDNPRDG